MIDMSVYEDNSVINLLYLEKLRNLDSDHHMLMGRARRFRLQDARSSQAPASGARDAVVEFTLPQIELPTVRPELYHKPYRYAYGIHKLDPKTHHTFADGIIKLDMNSSGSLDAMAHKTWLMPGCTPSEPIFVSRPGGEAEDDGVLLSIVLDEKRLQSVLVILDAQEMKEVARAEMRHVFPIGFHGLWAGD